MMIPSVHMNGTSCDSLVDALCNASTALRAAMAALQETYPNGRDYYPQGTHAIYDAKHEHEHRMEKVRAVKTEIDLIALALADIRDEQKGRAS